MLTASDVKFLTACGIAADNENFLLESEIPDWIRTDENTDDDNTQPPYPPEDGTTRILRDHGLEVNWANYLRALTFGKISDWSELDGEMQAELEGWDVEEDTGWNPTNSDHRFLKAMGVAR